MSMIWLSDKSQYARAFNQKKVRRIVSEMVTADDLPDPD